MLSVNAPAAFHAATDDSASLPAAVAPAIDDSLAGRDQALAISAVHLLVDGREVSVTSLNEIVEMEVGSTLEIVGIDYRLLGEESVSGKIAFEGYLNKLRGASVATDYSDGRFGGHEQEGELPVGSAAHSGLEGEWKLAAGTESITLVMVRYGANEVAVEDRVTIRTQVGTPDFVMYPKVVVRGSSRGIVTGEKVQLYGAWGNVGDGTYRNYMEVDIYHESDPTKIVWSGAIASVTTAGDYDSGEFLNKVSKDGFAKRWIPELGGTYTLKFYVDPENAWNEADEDNNVGTATLDVQDLRQVSRGSDTSFGRGANHHSFADTVTPDLSAAASRLAERSGLASSTTNSTPAADSERELVLEFVDPRVFDQYAPAKVQKSSQALFEESELSADEDRRRDAIDAALAEA